MKIAIDLRQIQMGTSGGIAPLHRGVLDAAIRRFHNHDFVVFGTIFNGSLIDPTPPNVEVMTLPLDGGFWEIMQQVLNDKQVDVLFRTYPVLDTLTFPMDKQVVFIPDIQHEHFPEFFSRSALLSRRGAFSRTLRSAGAIGTISEFARRTILEFEQTQCTDVFLMPPAPQVTMDADFASPSREFRDRLTAIGRFFFYPANLWKHKNHLRILEAFKLFKQTTGSDVAMVFTGHGEGWAKLSELYSRLPLHHLGFVSRAELRYLFQHSLALTFFSLYEGFGMPLLEAFEFNCPVICSNTTSLPEVGGNAVVTCDPTDVAAMAQLMNKISISSELRQSLIEAGNNRLAAFSWESSAQSLMEAFERVAAPRCRPAHSNREPLVSIVTPSFNQGRFLRRTIESVLGQTYKNIEYIVMDGGSTDETVEILRSYGKRFVWISEPDKGQTNAINKGFALSRGDIRAYLNSDDTLLPNAVERAVEYFSSHPRCDMVYGDANYIDTEDQIIGTYNTADYSFARLMFDCCVCQPAAFWRTDIAERVGPFDEHLNYAMDYDYWLRIDRVGGHIHHLRETLSNSRLYPETKTLSRRGEIFAEIFDVCLRQGGYIDFSYFIGYWHHLFWENPSPLTKYLRKLPKAHVLCAQAHHKWKNRDHYIQHLSSPNVRRAVLHLRSLLGRRLASRQRGLNLAPASGRVRGFWPDSWLEPLVELDTPNVAIKSELFLAGHAACECKLRITVGDKPVKTVHLRSKQEVRIVFPSLKTGPVRLSFSSSIVDGANRQLSFFVSQTNLFEEADMHS